MKGTVKPVRATILWGLLGAILYLPAGLLLHFRLTWPLGDWLFLWALLAGYSLMLSRWASKPVSSIALPLIILLVAALLLHSAATMGYVALGILAWIRSGICFTQRRPAMRFAAEIGLGMGASLAMPAGVLTGFLSWLEAIPPGRTGYRQAS